MNRRLKFLLQGRTIVCYLMLNRIEKRIKVQVAFLSIMYKLMCNVLFFFFQPFLYQLGYFIFSVLGNYNYFFFAAHLLDVAVGVAALKIILQAITHNGKELVLTLMLLTIIVYIYTVIAFNFFRQFYVSGEDEEESKMCHDMLTVSNQKN